MKEFDKLTTTDDPYDVWVLMTQTAMNALSGRTWTTDEIEDVFDLETMEKVFKICAGLDFSKVTDDPKAGEV